MEEILFIDLEIDKQNNRIKDFGFTTLHSKIKNQTDKLNEFKNFITKYKIIAGHNIINFDYKYIKNILPNNDFKIIDTLYLKALLFDDNELKLEKNYKNEVYNRNNPLADALISKNLCLKSIENFNNLPTNIKQILFYLLNNSKYFTHFFSIIEKDFDTNIDNIELLILKNFKEHICNINYQKHIKENSLELAFNLMKIYKKQKRVSEFLNMKFPNIDNVAFDIFSNPCNINCAYCSTQLSSKNKLKEFFGYNNFRTFGNDNISLQELATNYAISNRSLLAIFPTGGGKSITFQLPALIAYQKTGALTVVISPLQSLMKDQVDNLNSKGILSSTTINGSLTPIEREEAIKKVEDGLASILYISPEMLRSPTIKRVLLKRTIVRFVIDEAHCFSAWGHDFRVDYLYIATFIEELAKEKNLQNTIAVSCFTATAKTSVIEDIRNYFNTKLGINLKLFKSSSSRENLEYRAYITKNENEKYNKTREILENQGNLPAIIFVSRTKTATNIANKLKEDGFNSAPYHGQMDTEEKNINQENFIANNIDVIVATNAFGMGVDKDNIKTVIHYEISSSLENYVQESGRAGRDTKINAICHILFNEDDLNKHFTLLTQTKLHLSEIKQIWKAIKELTEINKTKSLSQKTIAQYAGFDIDKRGVQTKINSAILALEEVGYLKRELNSPRVYATSLNYKYLKDAQKALDKHINLEKNIEYIRVLSYLYTQKNSILTQLRNDSITIEDISLHLAIDKEKVINIIQFLRDYNIIESGLDLYAQIKDSKKIYKEMALHIAVEKEILNYLEENIENEIYLKEIFQSLKEKIPDISMLNIKTVLNSMDEINWIKKTPIINYHIKIFLNDSKSNLLNKIDIKKRIFKEILDFLSIKNSDLKNLSNNNKNLVSFSISELKDYINNSNLFEKSYEDNNIKETLYFLSKYTNIHFEGNFFVLYNPIKITRLKNNTYKFSEDDYKTLDKHYQTKTEQIHIVGKYAKILIEDYKKSKIFVDDYFNLDYNQFLDKYFKSEKRYLKKPITKKKFKQIFGKLTDKQKEIIDDKDSKNIVVTAWPGSGKTMILISKLASLILLENTKISQLLVLTFSNATVTEFKQRLANLIGEIAYIVDIKTFHSFAFDILGEKGDIINSTHIIKDATKQINNRKIEPQKITKTVLVIDEAQDISLDEYNLIKALIKYNEDIRVIAVGDDDQNIYEFRGSDPKYFGNFLRIEPIENNKKYELITNFRSNKTIVNFLNLISKDLKDRLKNNPLIAYSKQNSQINIFQYTKDTPIVIPLIDNVIKEYSKDMFKNQTTAILTSTNSDVTKIYGILNYNKIPCEIINSNNHFNLINLYIIKNFIRDLNDKSQISKKEFIEKFTQIQNNQNSESYKILSKIVETFLKTYSIGESRIYISDFENFIEQSKLEDFFEIKSGTITVSTIHKAKGKEFDNVFILLNDFNLDTQENIKRFYVAVSRTKQSLQIHYNGNYLQKYNHYNDIKYIIDNNKYDEPTILKLDLTHKDVILDHFYNIKRYSNNIEESTPLNIEKNGLTVNYNNKTIEIIKFSNSFKSKVEKLLSIGYIPTTSKILYKLYWQKKDSNKEIIIFLAQINFIKKADKN